MAISMKKVMINHRISSNFEVFQDFPSFSEKILQAVPIISHRLPYHLTTFYQELSKSPRGQTSEVIHDSRCEAAMQQTWMTIQFLSAKSARF